VNNVVPAIDDGLPALPVPEQGVLLDADALRGVGSSLSDRCRGANGVRGVVRGLLALVVHQPGPPLPELSSRLLLHGRKKTNTHGPAPAQRVLLSADLKYLAVSTKNCDEPTAHC